MVIFIAHCQSISPFIFANLIYLSYFALGEFYSKNRLLLLFRWLSTVTDGKPIQFTKMKEVDSCNKIHLVENTL